MPARGIQHLDLAVTDVERSLAFYRELLGPLGLEDFLRLQTYRGTEEVLYLRFGSSYLGIRPADGGAYRHYAPGIEHLAFQVDSRQEVDEAHGHYAYLDEQDYYAFFAFDPDGIRVEVCYDAVN